MGYCSIDGGTIWNKAGELKNVLYLVGFIIGNCKHFTCKTIIGYGKTEHWDTSTYN